MTKQTIDNLQPGTLDGDSLFRTAEKINENFNEIYSHFGDGQHLDDGYAGLKGLNAGLITSAGAGAYNVRELVAGSTAISITNGTGSGGNPTIDLPDTGVLSAGSSPTAFADVGITVDVKGRILSITTPTFLASAQAAASTATSSVTTIANSLADANKLAINAEDSQYTLSDGTTTGFSALHHAAKAAADVATIGTSLSQANQAKTDAETAKTAAETARDTAVTKAGEALQSASDASSHASTASGHATTASGHASTASGHATTAGSHKTDAETAKTAAETAKTAAESAKTAAETAFDNFDDIYLGDKSSAPTQDNDGDALSQGSLYFDTTANELKVYNGSSWQGGVTATGGFMTATNNLSDLNNAATSRTNLGLGTIATQASDSVAITGGSISGITDLAIADGGTGASTASAARTNLGLDSLLAAKAPLASPALTGSPTVNGVAIATGGTELGTLTQTFLPGQTTTINLSANALSPSVAVTKEVPQIGITNNQWNVDSAGTGNYTRYNTAPATTISFSGSTATLGTGSFSASDVGKTIEVNNGKLVLTNANGTFVVASTPDNYNQAASGAWQMYSLVFNTTDTDLEVSNTLTNAYDLSTAVWSKKYDHVGITQPNAMEWVDSGTKLFILDTFNNTVYSYTASTPYDVGSLTYVAQRTVSSGDNANMGMAVKPDGTVLYVIGTQWNAVYSFNMSTPYDPSSASAQYSSYFSANTQLSGGSVSAHSLFFKPDGTAFYVNGYSTATGRVYQYNLNTAWDITTASYSNYGPAVVSYNQGLTFNSDGTRFYIGERGGKTIRTYQINNTPWSLYDTSGPIASFDVSSHIDYPDGLAFNNDGSRFYVTGPSRDDIVQWDVGALLAPSGYHAAHTTTSVDSSTWTDINSMTATESAGSGTVNYAVSTDDRTTWKIIHNTSGARNIVKNNSGTWQYNSNATYGSETWVNGTTNNELATLQQAMEGAILVTNAYAVSNFSSTYGTAGNLVLDVSTYATAPRDIQISADGLKLFIACANTQTVQEWHMTSAFDTGTASYVRNHSLNGQREPNPDCLFFNADGTRFWVSGGQGWLVEYSVSTGFDLSSTVSFVRELNIYSNVNGPTGITFNPTGDKMFLCDGSSRSYGQDRIVEYALTTNFDISTASYTRHFLLSTIDLPRGIQFNADGTKMFTAENNGYVYEYTLSTGFDISTASNTSSAALGSYHNSLQGFIFNSFGTKIFTVDDNLDRVSQATLGSHSFTNQMSKTQLEAVSDANQFAVSDDLDLAIILNLSSGTGVPSSDGVSINYDANVANQGAILGTDYNYDVPALNKVRITSVNAATLKVRVV